MIYTESLALFGYLLSLPEKRVLERGCPLVVGLHGGGNNPEQLITLWDAFPSKSFIYAVPQAPYPVLDDGEFGFDWAMWPSGDEALIGKATELSERYIVNVVQNLTDRHKIDQVYLLGFSQGAIFSYLVGIKQHPLFRGLISFSGPGLLAPLVNPFAGSFSPAWLTEEYIQAAQELRVFIVHGRDDRGAKYEMGVKSREILVKHGYDVTFCDFEGGHRLPPENILEQVVNWINIPHQKI